MFRNAKWDWFNARNYCRKRCMDLVSFETKQEYDWVKGFINGRFKEYILVKVKCRIKDLFKFLFLLLVKTALFVSIVSHFM